MTHDKSADLVRRLRDQQTKFMTPILGQAADTITALIAENERLRVALKPFAEAEQYCDPEFGNDYAPSWAEFFTLGDFRRAHTSA